MSTGTEELSTESSIAKLRFPDATMKQAAALLLISPSIKSLDFIVPSFFNMIKARLVPITLSKTQKKILLRPFSSEGRKKAVENVSSLSLSFLPEKSVARHVHRTVMQDGVKKLYHDTVAWKAASWNISRHWPKGSHLLVKPAEHAMDNLSPNLVVLRSNLNGFFYKVAYALIVAIVHRILTVPDAPNMPCCAFLSTKSLNSIASYSHSHLQTSRQSTPLQVRHLNKLYQVSLKLFQATASIIKHLSSQNIDEKDLSSTFQSFFNANWFSKNAERIEIWEKVISFGSEDDLKSFLISYHTKKEKSLSWIASLSSFPILRKVLWLFSRLCAPLLAMMLPRMKTVSSYTFRRKTLRRGTQSQRVHALYVMVSNIENLCSSLFQRSRIIDSDSERANEEISKKATVPSKFVEATDDVFFRHFQLKLRATIHASWRLFRRFVR